MSGSSQNLQKASNGSFVSLLSVLVPHNFHNISIKFCFRQVEVSVSAIKIPFHYEILSKSGALCVVYLGIFPNLSNLFHKLPQKNGVHHRDYKSETQS